MCVQIKLQSKAQRIPMQISGVLSLHISFVSHILLSKFQLPQESHIAVIGSPLLRETAYLFLSSASLIMVQKVYPTLGGNLGDCDTYLM